MRSSKPRKPPRRTPPEVWALVRAAYTSGATAGDCKARFGVEEGALRARSRRHGWTKKAAWAAREAELAAAPVPEVDLDNPDDGLSIAETALARAIEALRAGRAADAAALIKAGDAVGDFAEFVRGKRRQAAARAGEDA